MGQVITQKRETKKPPIRSASQRHIPPRRADQLVAVSQGRTFLHPDTLTLCKQAGIPFSTHEYKCGWIEGDKVTLGLTILSSQEIEVKAREVGLTVSRGFVRIWYPRLSMVAHRTMVKVHFPE